MSSRIKCSGCGAQSFNGKKTILFCNNCYCQLREALEWHDANDLPDKDGYYIVCWKFEYITTTGEAWWDHRGWTFPALRRGCKRGSAEYPKVLYWMEMPLPPKQALAATKEGGE